MTSYFNIGGSLFRYGEAGSGVLLNILGRSTVCSSIAGWTGMDLICLGLVVLAYRRRSIGAAGISVPGSSRKVIEFLGCWYELWLCGYIVVLGARERIAVVESSVERDDPRDALDEDDANDVPLTTCALFELPSSYIKTVCRCFSVFRTPHLFFFLRKYQTRTNITSIRIATAPHAIPAIAPTERPLSTGRSCGIVSTWK